jgi:hypothetical protein
LCFIILMMPCRCHAYIMKHFFPVWYNSCHQPLIYSMPTSFSSRHRKPSRTTLTTGHEVHERGTYRSKQAMHRSCLLLPVITSWWHHAYVVIKTFPLLNKQHFSYTSFQ